MTAGLLVVAVVLLAGTGIGVWRRRTDGRLTDAKPTPSPSATATSTPSASATSTPSASATSTRSASATSTPSASATSTPSATPLASATSAAAATQSAAETLSATSAASATPPAAATQAQPVAVASPIDPELLAALGVGAASATLLQFSTVFCAPCRAVRRISAEVAEMVPGVQHVEVDAESHLGAVRALDIWRTPTLLVLDADGREIKRATGVPGKAQLIAALGEVIKA